MKYDKEKIDYQFISMWIPHFNFYVSCGCGTGAVASTLFAFRASLTAYVCVCVSRYLLLLFINQQNNIHFVHRLAHSFVNWSYFCLANKWIFSFVWQIKCCLSFSFVFLGSCASMYASNSSHCIWIAEQVKQMKWPGAGCCGTWMSTVQTRHWKFLE